jgi:hypothetical protein
MSIITVPFNYDSKVDRKTIPICISNTDAYGNPIHFGWIERGVVPVADKLLQLAGKLLHDEWRASEITESVVHKLSRDFGAQLGTNPSLKLLSCARWHAQDLRVGSRRARRKTDVPLFFDFREEVEPDEFDLASAIAAQDTLDRLVEQLNEMEMYDVRDMIPMMLRDCDSQEYNQRFKKSRNAVTHQFYRGMRKAAQAAGITGTFPNAE